MRCGAVFRLSSPLTPSEGVVLSRIFLLLRKEWNSCSTPTVARVCVLLKGTHLLLEEGADKSGFSSSPSGTRNCATPSIGPSAGHTSALCSRRCRRKRRFIVTFRHSRLCDLVRMHFAGHVSALFPRRHRIAGRTAVAEKGCRAAPVYRPYKCTYVISFFPQRQHFREMLPLRK